MQKKIVKLVFAYLLILINNIGFAQDLKRARPNWQNLDLKNDGLFGISVIKAYKELLNEKSLMPVTVAVIDGGVDINHADLNSKLWVNLRETPNNQKDDDHNNYVDDMDGWNFMGSTKGSFQFDNIDLVRLLRDKLKKDPFSRESRGLQIELNIKKENLESGLRATERQLVTIKNIIKKMNKHNPSINDFKNYKCESEDDVKAVVTAVRSLKFDSNYLQKLENDYHAYKNQLNYFVNIDYDPRKDDKSFLKDFYGNNDVIGPDPKHGTHVAGIIAASSNSKEGIQGIASNALIMSVRAIPDGETFDKDLANAIRYAVNNGAKIINLSEGKATSPDRKLVDEAVKYAMGKNVLIVHAAGNEGNQLEIESGFPSRQYLNGGKADAWIEVGASNNKDNESLLAWFSNYGKKTVDVFAPGVDIYSTFPNNAYAYENGTSMAAPVVSGVAALLFGSYPNLTASQVKEIIMRSVVKVGHSVKTNNGNMINFSDTCISGGIVNAFNALQLAAKF